MTSSSTRQNTSRQNISIDAQGSNEGAKPGGAAVERVITVRNRGSVTANIDLWIRPNDANSEPLMRWCTLTATIASNVPENAAEEQRKGISGVRMPQVEPKGSREVILRIDVPPKAEPGFYSYDIVAQAAQYPGEQSQRTQQLRVLASSQDVGLRDEPSWELDPPTSSDNPYPLAAGGTLKVKVSVHNPTDAVDRYWLSCPELDASWFDPPLYPEADPNAAGFIVRTDGLALNPGESGEIILPIHPPALTPAGYYSSTLRLSSFNRDNLVLLDIIYLDVEVDDRLLMQLEPPICKIPSPASSFYLNVSNPGNINRQLSVTASDQNDCFTYALQPDRLSLIPGETHKITILPHARKWWRRSWRGQEQEIDVDIALLNWQPDQQSDETIAASDLPSYFLPDAVAGKILWQSRPPWILRLLRLLRTLLWLSLILLLLAGACGLAYWLLRELVVKPSLEPKILEFSSAAETYQAGTGNPIRLDWKTSNPNNPQADARAIVTYYASDGRAIFSQTYALEDLIPQQQIPSNSCEIGKEEPNGVLRLLRQLYGYTPDQGYRAETLTCLGIAPQPNGSTAQFKPGEYQVKLETIANKVQNSPTDVLSGISGWMSDRIPQRTAPDIDCTQDCETSDAERLKQIKLTPPPPPVPPEILYFYSKAPVYRQTSAGAANSENGAAAQLPSSPIQLNWIVNNSRNAEALELNAVNVAPDGTIQNRRVRYALQNGIPVDLAGQCRLQEQRLICENVPTQAEAPGKYNFTLNVVMSRGQNADQGANQNANQTMNQITKDSEAIEVRPPLPEIQSFRANGQDVLQTPQLVQTINPARGPANVTLTWQVQNPEQMKIELLPAPGALNSSESSITYTLSPTPGNTTLTLQVTNQAGETVSRSVTIQTTAFVPPPSPPAPDAAASPTPPPLPDVAVPSSPVSPEDLPVFELPPRSN